MIYFDTHAHYDDESFDPDREALLSSLPGRNVAGALIPGTNAASTKAAIMLAEKYDYVFAASGIHPHDAGKAGEADFEDIYSLALNPRVKAIGEIGLDYHYGFSEREVQRKALERQLSTAEQLGLPVILHDREAHEDCLGIIKQFPAVRGVYHCYSGSWEYAKEVLRLGWYISFTGSVTFKNAYSVAETAAKMPMDFMMIETDSPYMTPVPHRGKRNDSGYLPFINERIAELRGIPPEEAAEALYKNSIEFFRL
ncbi:MAG: TatD family hydrolase [Oscillospiraceae bacterium]|jgi:TatD DNase family protein|nr:TatD family hydrolase [Oscillospiraceae bacterium]